MRNLVFQCGLGAAIIVTPALASEPNGQSSAQTGCEIHVWQRDIYVSEAHANYAALGLLGSALQAGHDRKYPPASIEGLMEQEFNATALPATLSGIAWQNYTRSAANHVVFEQETINDSDFKNLKAGSARKSASQSDCYIEIYIGRQTFSGGSLKSHLFSDLYARTYYGDRFAAKSAIIWDQTRRVSITDEQSLNDARNAFKIAFANNLDKFLQSKLPKR